jgi:hypothetical protein
MTKTIRIVRFKESDNSATVGKCFLDDKFFCFTMEQPWNDNEPYKSCIPTGVYNLVDFNSPKFGHTYALVNEVIGVTPYKTNLNNRTNRYAILFHSANWAKQLNGCIALGERLITDGNGDKMITSSANMTRNFLKKINSDSVVEIVNEGDWQ